MRGVDAAFLRPQESTTNALPDLGSPTREGCMQTAIEQSEHREQHNGLDRSLDTPNNGSGFFAAYVRPYLGYAATFAAGAVIGAHYFSAEGSTDSLGGRGKGQSSRASGVGPIMPCYVNHPVEFPPFPCATSPCTRRGLRSDGRELTSV